MKNVRLIFVAVTAILFLGMESVKAQNNNPKTVIIRAFEIVLGTQSKMIVTEPSGTSQIIELKSLDYRKGENMSFNQAAIQAEINKWKKEGFEIDAVTVGSLGDFPFTTIILSKKE